MAASTDLAVRSAAERYDPPVGAATWTLPHDRPCDEVYAEGRERCGLDAEGWERMLWHGGLHFDRRRVTVADASSMVRAGVAIRAYWFLREPEAIPVTRREVLFEHPHVLAIDKPAWLPTQPTRSSVRFCLEHQARETLGESWLFAAHRLDRGTSGVTLFARTPEGARILTRQFEERRVEKRYLAIVSPHPKKPRWSVEGYLERVAHPSHAFYQLRSVASANARNSETDFEVLEVRADAALVAATPRTGRTHQLRVHLAAGGTPILGDRLYGPPTGGSPPERLMLHAESVRFAGFGGAPMCVRAPVPAGWAW